jgi:serine/threonine-protein phosphatase 5
MAKFGDRAKHLYRKLLGCFEGHPLAARVAGCVYMAHGGLFRQVEKDAPKKSKMGKSYRYVRFSFLMQ